MLEKIKRYIKGKPVVRNPKQEYKYWKRHRYFLQPLRRFLKQALEIGRICRIEAIFLLGDTLKS